MKEPTIDDFVKMKIAFDKANLPKTDRYAIISKSLGRTDPETGIVEFDSYYNMGDGSWTKIK